MLWMNAELNPILELKEKTEIRDSIFLVLILNGQRLLLIVPLLCMKETKITFVFSLGV